MESIRKAAGSANKATPTTSDNASLDEDAFSDDLGEEPFNDESQDSVKEKAMRITRLRVPLFFLGLGVYRAWIELVYINPGMHYPTQIIGGRDFFDSSLIAALLVMAVFARKIAPLRDKKWAAPAMLVLLLGSTVVNFYSLWDPSAVIALSIPAAVCGGVGIALMILMWSEFYGSINPVRVAVYYSASLVFGAFIIYWCRGLYAPWLFAACLLMPICSVACLLKSYRAIPQENLPKAERGNFTFPWKPVALMAIYGFAYGMREVDSCYLFGPHAAFGTLAVGLIVFLAVAYRGNKFDLTLIYRIGLPAMVVGLLVVSMIGSNAVAFSSFCVTGSYTAFSILIMIICANLCYRYGASAVFLFGIERAVRLICMFAGRQAESFITTSPLAEDVQQLTIAIIVVVLLIFCTMMLVSEKDVTSNWGMTIKPQAQEVEPEIASINKLGTSVTALARECGLSHREEEVLLLLGQHKTISDIEHELFIANGTAKAHIRHIYRKVDVHSRKELLAKLGIE